jgi:23S rRNA (adenine1618-N6)-methyltransferase
VIILNNRVVWNFSSQQSLIRLTQAIMKHIFRVHWTCPPSNLCPRIPSRINYLLWLHIHVPSPIRRVLDVGTGATLIYPLLGWAIFQWRFVAIEISQRSF